MPETQMMGYSRSTLFLFGAAILALQCSGGKGSFEPANASNWIFEGWACAPEPAMIKKGRSPAHYCDGKPADFLYFKLYAESSRKILPSGEPGRHTCARGAWDQIKGKRMAGVLSKLFERGHTHYDLRPGMEQIMSRLPGTTRRGIYDCCALDPETGLCVAFDKPKNWSECQCVAYQEMTGGQKGLIRALKRIESGE